jgi:hypothetical protein
LQGGVAKSLKVMTTEQIQQVASLTEKYRKLLGYDLVSPSNGESSSPTEDGFRIQLSTNLLGESDRRKALEDSIGDPDGLDATQDSVIINEAFSIRQQSDKFGRDFNRLRMSLTDNDCKPLMTK